jgi:hypothetical protein
MAASLAKQIRSAVDHEGDADARASLSRPAVTITHTTLSPLSDHDLSGFNEAQVPTTLLTHLPRSSCHVVLLPQVHQLMAAAFTDPIPAAKPLGFRFTVGGGKKVCCNCTSPSSSSSTNSLQRCRAGACQVRRRYAEVVSRGAEERGL